MNKSIISASLFFTILLIFITLSNIYSQDPNKDTLEIIDNADLVFDSLMTKLNTETEDTSKVNILNEIAWEYAPTNFEKSKKFADSALALSKEIGWEKGEAFALKNIGEVLGYNGNVEESILKYEYALKLFKKFENQNEIARVYNHLGISYLHLSKLKNSFENFNYALNIYRDIGNEEGIVKGYTYLGALFYQFNDYEKSLNYYKKALKIAERLKKTSTYASLIANMGMIYNKLENYDEALRYYKISEKIYKDLNDMRNYSIHLGNISDLYLKQKRFDEAIVYSKKALYFRTKMNDKYGIAYQNANLGEIRFKKALNWSQPDPNNNKQKLLMDAINNLKISFQIFEEIGNLIEQKEDLVLLSKVYKENNNYIEALKTLERAQAIGDSLQIGKAKSSIASLEAKQNLILKQKEIEILNKENEYQRLIKKVLIGIAMLFVAISLFTFYQYANNKKRSRILEENIQIRSQAEEALKKNEMELKKHKNQLELIVRKRTSELEKEISERKRTEEDLLVAIDRVEAANKAKSVFLENMSHELRTPLVGILGYSELLHGEVPTKELKEMADGINRTGNRLLNTLSMVLDLARIESDKFEINITEVNVEQELRQIYNNFKGAVAVKNIDFSLELCDDAKFLASDSGIFKVIVENLVNNAIKFTKKGKITIETKIESENTKRNFIVNVIDTGIGIKKNEIPMIFNEFKQLSEGTLKDFQGTGLGLSISKKFIEHLNGELIVKSEFGEGSKFTLKFPIV